MKNKLLNCYYTILAKLAHHYISRNKPKVIGINGSVGKTSCRMIIYQTLQKFLPDMKISTSPKNFNGELGLSLSVFEITDRTPNVVCFFKTFFACLGKSILWKKKYDIIVLEYGIDRPWEMEFILQVAKPDIGVFTAIDSVHSEQFGSPVDIAREEVKMALNTKELVFLNMDDTYAMQLSPEIQVDKLTYQTKEEKNADLHFDEIRFVMWRWNHEVESAFDLFLKWRKVKIKTNIYWKANYGYIAVALTIAETLAYQYWKMGILNETKGSIELEYQLQPWRFSIFAGKYDSIILDSTYNSSPRSMREIIDTTYTIRQQLFPWKEIRLILWDMRELGDLTEQEHRLLAGYVSQVADQVLLLGDSMCRFMADELCKIWFNTATLQAVKTRNELNKNLEKMLSETEESPLLVFKWSQNTIFLEECVKYFLKNESDSELLTRQSKFWLGKK